MARTLGKRRILCGDIILLNIMLMSMTGQRKRWISCFWSILNLLLQITKVGLDCECLGGGRIEHKEADKYIKVTFLFSSNCRIRVVLPLKLYLFRCTAIRWGSARLITRRALRSWRDGTLTTPSIGRMMATNDILYWAWNNLWKLHAYILLFKMWGLCFIKNNFAFWH